MNLNNTAASPVADVATVTVEELMNALRQYSLDTPVVNVGGRPIAVDLIDGPLVVIV